MRHRHRVRYEITVFGPPWIWWSRTRRLWTETIGPGCSSRRTYRTFRRAIRHARGILDRWPTAEPVILRYAWTHGRSVVMEFAFKREPQS